MNFNKTKFHYTNPAVQLFLIIIAAIAIRVYFFNGIVFSDDTYYDFLGISLEKGSYANGYLGYPIFLLRKLHTVFTAISFSLFGINQIASIVFPFVISISGIILIYFIAFELTDNQQVAVLSAFLLAFFPTDLIFATINFTDLQTAFFINLGLLFLLKAVKLKSYIKAILAGAILFLSFLFKANVYYILILLLLLLIYLLNFKILDYKFILIALITFFILLLGETTYYSIAQNDFFYRLNILNINYQICYYNFFPNNIVANPANTMELASGLLKQVFVLNIKHFFLRRFYLFLPLIALVYSFYLIKIKKHKLLVFWFIGLAILMIGFTTSFTDYKPLDLKLSNYIFTAVFPIIILSALFLSKLSRKLFIALSIIYILSSLVMSHEYQNYFDVKNNQQFIEFVQANKGKTIYTDHHTAYGLYVISGYGNKRIKIFTDKPKIQLQPNSLLIYNKDEIDELKKQKFIFPDFNELKDSKLKLINKFGKFGVFEVLKHY